MRGMGSDEREQTLNQLLTELDGFDGESLVICLAATNRADMLDSALKRTSFGVSVERPDKQGRGNNWACKLEAVAAQITGSRWTTSRRYERQGSRARSSRSRSTRRRCSRGARV